MATLTLHYENARQAQQLFDNDSNNLRLLQSELEVQVTSREGWIKLEGEQESIDRAKEVFGSLQSLVDSGQHPSKHEFVQAVEMVKDNGADALKSLGEDRIPTSPRKAVSVALR